MWVFTCLSRFEAYQTVLHNEIIAMIRVETVSSNDHVASCDVWRVPRLVLCIIWDTHTTAWWTLAKSDYRQCYSCMYWSSGMAHGFCRQINMDSCSSNSSVCVFIISHWCWPLHCSLVFQSGGSYNNEVLISICLQFNVNYQSFDIWTRYFS